MNNAQRNLAPLATVLINNYNYGRYVADAIESALNQTYRPIEIIVVDDGSTDDSRQVIASYREKVTAVLKENGGQASAINAGFLHSKGEIICLLDSDDTFMADKVQMVVEALQKSSDSRWCFHRTRVLNASGQLLTSCGPAISGEFDYRKQARTARLRVDLPATSGLVFRRDLLREMLPMPEASGIDISDAYLKCLALLLAKAVSLNSELAVQRVHGANRYTYNSTDLAVSARILVKTAGELRRRFPVARKLANKLIASAMYESIRNDQTPAENGNLYRAYLDSCNVFDRSEIRLRALYHLSKWKLRKLAGKQAVDVEVQTSK